MTFINGPLPKKSPEAKKVERAAKKVSTPKWVREQRKPSKCVTLYKAPSEHPSAA